VRWRGICRVNGGMFGIFSWRQRRDRKMIIFGRGAAGISMAKRLAAQQSRGGGSARHGG